MTWPRHSSTASEGGSRDASGTPFEARASRAGADVATFRLSAAVGAGLAIGSQVMRALALRSVVIAGAALVAGCPGERGPRTEDAREPAVAPLPADAFLAAIAEHCGQAFAGRVVANQPVQEEDPFAGEILVMHLRECAEGDLRIPFHVGGDRSRTWVLTRTAGGLRLAHDHRHEDGSADAITLYGGETATVGTARRQELPVDAESIALFEREGPRGLGDQRLGDGDRPRRALPLRTRSTRRAPVLGRVRPRLAGRPPSRPLAPAAARVEPVGGQPAPQRGAVVWPGVRPEAAGCHHGRRGRGASGPPPPVTRPSCPLGPDRLDFQGSGKARGGLDWSLRSS